MTDHMKALVYEGPEQLVIREVAIPDLADDEVLIQVKRVGICGSELGGYLGHNSLRTPPLIMGHEFAGVIAKTGRKVNKIKKGDRVTANPLVSCGDCTACTSGRANLCHRRALLGAHRPGAFAEYIAVPERYVYLLPAHVSMEEGAMAEPLACAIHIARLAHMTALDRLIVAGAGPIGLFVLITAQAMGLKEVVVLDINHERLEIVRKLGGIGVSSQEELLPHTPMEGFDVSVDAVGIDATRQQCIQALKPGGRVIFSGLHAADSILPVNLTIRQEIVMSGAFAYNPADFDIAVKWLDDGMINLDPWTMLAPLEEGKACFEKLIHHPGKTAKIMLSI